MVFSRYLKCVLFFAAVFSMQSCFHAQEEEKVDADGYALGREMGYSQLRCNIELDKTLRKDLPVPKLEFEIETLKEKFFNEYVELLAKRQKLEKEELSLCDKKYMEVLETADTSRINFINMKAASLYNINPKLANDIAGLNINFRYSDYTGLIEKPEIINSFFSFNQKDYEVKW